MADVMKIGIVGLGQIAENAYLPDLHDPNEGFEVTWLCDSADHRLKWAQTSSRRPATTKRYDDMLSDGDSNWVFVLTPLMAHAAMVRRLSWREKMSTPKSRSPWISTRHARL